MTSHSFSYCEHCCSQSFFSTVPAREAAPSYLYTQSYRLQVLHQQNNNWKKMQHYSGRSSFAEKVLFSKKKKWKKEKTRLDLDLTFLLTLQALQPALFFCRCSARSARSCPRPFGPLLASPRFSLHTHSCSFKILLQYPWKLQRFAYKKPNLAAVWPGPKDRQI